MVLGSVVGHRDGVSIYRYVVEKPFLLLHEQ